MFFSHSNQNRHFEQYKNLKKFIKKFPTLWKFFTWSKDRLINLSRLIDVLMMMILFHVWPEQTYRFSTRKLLPSKKNRLSKELRSIIPYELLMDKSSKISKMKEITVIGKGNSSDLNYLKKIKGPIFLIAFWGPIRIDGNGNLIGEKYTPGYNKKLYGLEKSRDDESFFKDKNNKEFKSRNITYVLGASKIKSLAKIKKNGHKILTIDSHIMNSDGSYSTVNTDPSNQNLMENLQCQRISITNKIYQRVPSGSFLACVCALSYFAEKINVYGWDFYLNSSPERMGYWELFLNTYKFRKDLRRSKNFFESALINFYYGYQFSKLPNINIHGYMGQLSKHDKLMKRIERVLFN